MAKKIIISILVILLSLAIGFGAGMVVQNGGFDGILDFVKTGQKAEEPIVLEGKVVTVGQNTANIYEKADSNSAVIYSMSNGETAACVEESGEWLKLEIIEGVYGYAHANLFSIASDSDIANDTETKEPVEPETTYVTPTVNVLDIYAEDSSDSEIVETVEDGAVLELTEKGDTWSKVTTLDGKSGYVLTSDIETTDFDPDMTLIRVTNSFVNIRSEATSNSSKLGSLDEGETAEYLGEEGNFYNIKTEDGTVGWVSKDYVELTDAAGNPLESAPAGDSEEPE